MCVSAPDVPPPPAKREAPKTPELPTLSSNKDPNQRRRRGYAALMAGSRSSLQPPATTSTLGG